MDAEEVMYSSQEFPQRREEREASVECYQGLQGQEKERILERQASEVEVLGKHFNMGETFQKGQRLRKEWRGEQEKKLRNFQSTGHWQFNVGDGFKSGQTTRGSLVAWKYEALQSDSQGKTNCCELRSKCETFFKFESFDKGNY